jgi:hypothetical protein
VCRVRTWFAYRYCSEMSISFADKCMNGNYGRKSTDCQDVCVYCYVLVETYDLLVLPHPDDEHLPSERRRLDYHAIA